MKNSYLKPPRHISSHFLHVCMWGLRGVLHYWHTQGFSVSWQEAALPGQSACLINNTRVSGRTMYLKDSKCGPQSLSLWHTYCTKPHTHSCFCTLSCILCTKTLGLSFLPFLSLSLLIRKQYPAYNCKLGRHPHSFAVKGKWPWWWVIAFTQIFFLFNTLKWNLLRQS